MDSEVEQILEECQWNAERRLSLHAAIIFAGALAADVNFGSDAHIAWAVRVAKKAIEEAGRQA